MRGDRFLRRYPTAPNMARKALGYDCPPASPSVSTLWNGVADGLFGGMGVGLRNGCLIPKFQNHLVKQFLKPASSLT